MKRKQILVVNDDGVEAPGIKALAKVASQFGDVIVSAPFRERSANGHGITLHKPLRYWNVREGAYATNGTPVDSVRLAIKLIADFSPDLVVSGINRGANLGVDIYYSGTVAGAREAAILGIPSIAFSLVRFENEHPEYEYSWAMKPAKEVMAQFFDNGFSMKLPFLNINIPNRPESEQKGMCLARLGVRYYSNEIEERIDPKGEKYYWISGELYEEKVEERTDAVAVGEGFTSVTPLVIDATDPAFDTLSL